jgi:pilus assembly protein CpaE
MLRAAIISPDTDLNDGLEELFSGLDVISLVRSVDHYPVSGELTRLLRSAAPHVLFVAVESSPKLLEIVRAVETSAPGVQIVAIGRTSDPQTLLEAMRAGVREFLSLPFHRQTLYDCLARVQEQAEKRPPQIESTDRLFCFLPTKPGVGASTVAVNAALALARLPDAQTLLLDLDLNCGLVRFMLQLDNQYSVRDAVERGHTLDESMWPQLVSKVGQLDVLHGGGLNPESGLDTTNLHNLIEFTRRNYRAILMDLSGNMERHSVEAMSEAKRIFLVTTPEVSSLHLAREKLAFLRSVNLAERVSLLLNRCQKRAVISQAQVQDLLGIPVTMSFQNDYQAVNRALTGGKAVESATDLGKQFGKLAELLMEKPKPETAETSKRRFVEYFSVFPAKMSSFADKKSAV